MDTTRPPDVEPDGDDLLAALERAAEGGDLPVEPELRALADAYRDVHKATGVLADDVSECTVTFDDVERRLGDEGRIIRPWAVRAAAAAALVVAVAGAAWWGASPGDTGDTVDVGDVGDVRDSDNSGDDGNAGDGAGTVVRLGELAAAPAVADVSHDPVAHAALRAAPVLADFASTDGDGMRWLESLETARDVARVSGRPILLFIHHPTCPWCITLRQETFQDDGVATLLRDYVPVRVDVQTLPADLRPLLERGWPYLGALDAAGAELVAFPGPSPADVLTEGLRNGLDSHGMEGARPWGPMRALAARLARAESAVDDGRLADAVPALDALIVADGAGPFGTAARELRDTVAASARQIVVEAGAASVGDAQTALLDLDEAVTRFEGTPWEADLMRVRDALRESGRFPRLEPPIDRPDPDERR